MHSDVLLERIELRILLQIIHAPRDAPGAAVPGLAAPGA